MKFLLQSIFLMFTIPGLVMMNACSSSGKSASRKEAVEKLNTKNIQYGETQFQSPLEKQLTGQWQWHKTVCCSRRPITHLADTSAKEIILTFNVDGTYSRVENGINRESGNYRIDYGKIYPDRPALIMGEHHPALIEIKSDTLRLDWGYMDLQTEYYIRFNR